MAELEEFVISNEQAKAFARAIYADIAKYVEKHRDEFEKFLDQENTIKEDFK